MNLIQQVYESRGPHSLVEFSHEKSWACWRRNNTNSSTRAMATAPEPKTHIQNVTSGSRGYLERDDQIHDHNPQAVHNSKNHVGGNSQWQRDFGLVGKQEAANHLTRFRRQDVSFATEHPHEYRLPGALNQMKVNPPV